MENIILIIVVSIIASAITTIIVSNIRNKRQKVMFYLGDTKDGCVRFGTYEEFIKQQRNKK